MTNEQQPEALRLAGILGDHYFYADTNEAAGELRRLHAENEDYRRTCEHLLRQTCEQIGEIVALKEQRDELLEALHTIERWRSHASDFAADYGATGVRDLYRSIARAAIAKAGGAA